MEDSHSSAREDFRLLGHNSTWTGI